jgi:hypothetical protein
MVSGEAFLGWGLSQYYKDFAKKWKLLFEEVFAYLQSCLNCLMTYCLPGNNK